MQLTDESWPDLDEGRRKFDCEVEVSYKYHVKK